MLHCFHSLFAVTQHVSDSGVSFSTFLIALTAVLQTVIIKTNECPFFIFQAGNNHLNLSDCLNFELVKIISADVQIISTGRKTAAYVPQCCLVGDWLGAESASCAQTRPVLQLC